MHRVSFQVAKLAQEKGYGKEFGKSVYQDIFYTHKEGVKVSYAYYPDFDEWKDFKRKCKYLVPAPFQTELQEWLIKEHGLNVLPSHDRSSNKYLVWITCSNPDTSICSYKGFDNIHEAIEEGLLDALKLIKNEK